MPFLRLVTFPKSIKIWGPRPARLCLAGRRYAAPLAGLLGPSENFAKARFLWSGLRPRLRSAGPLTQFFSFGRFLRRLGGFLSWAKALVFLGGKESI